MKGPFMKSVYLILPNHINRKIRKHFIFRFLILSCTSDNSFWEYISRVTNQYIHTSCFLLEKKTWLSTQWRIFCPGLDGLLFPKAYHKDNPGVHYEVTILFPLNSNICAPLNSGEPLIQHWPTGISQLLKICTSSNKALTKGIVV